jgi:hypothetical protein
MSRSVYYLKTELTTYQLMDDCMQPLNKLLEYQSEKSKRIKPILLPFNAMSIKIRICGCKIWLLSTDSAIRLPFHHVGVAIGIGEASSTSEVAETKYYCLPNATRIGNCFGTFTKRKRLSQSTCEPSLS